MILFDLDDTIFDHKHSRLCGLAALQNLIPSLKSISLKALESEHDKLLLANYGATLSGQLSVDDARVERIKNLLVTFGVQASTSLLQEALPLRIVSLRHLLWVLPIPRWFAWEERS